MKIRLSIEGLYCGLDKSFSEDKGMGQFQSATIRPGYDPGPGIPRGCGVWRNPNKGIFIDMLFLSLCTLRELSLTLFYVLLMGCTT